jgi:hypothetical protein
VEPPASPPAARGKPADPPRAESGSAWTPVLSTAAPPPVAAAPSAARESIDAAADSFILVDSSAAGAVRAAQKLDEEAASNPSVSAYEAAAGGWERSLGLLHGEGYREARLRLADARYRVWQLEPNGERAAMAAAAIRAYLIDAPPGPERGKATRWLLEVEENRYR